MNPTKITVTDTNADPFAQHDQDTVFTAKGTTANAEHHIHGDSGNDTFISGAGHNFFFAGPGENTVSYQNAGSGVDVDLSTVIGSAKSHDGKIVDTLHEVQDVVGSKFADHIKMGAEGGEVTGGRGGDTITLTDDTSQNGGTNVLHYTSFHDSNAHEGVDKILGFHGINDGGSDLFDFSKLEKSAGLDDNKVHFVGDHGIKNVGDYGFSYDAKHDVTNVEMRVDSNPAHDLMIQVSGHHDISGEDFTHLHHGGF